MRHIAFLALTLTRGGAERVIVNLCNDYLVNQNRITIITCLHKPLGYVLDDRIEHICIEKTSDIHYANLGERFLKRRRLLKEVLEQVRPDVLLCFLPEPNFLALSLKKYFSFPMIISVRNDPAKEYKNKIYYALMRYLYPKADGYVFQTEDAREYFAFSKHIQEKSRVIPNPLGEQFLGVVPCPAEEREKVIVNVGKLTPQKNQALTIRAFGKIANQFPDYQLLIFGEGDLRKELEDLTEELGLGTRVSFEGNVSNLSERIYKASLFVMSSDYEGMPNALMEALAMGIPCISTDCPCGGPKFLIEEGVSGTLIPVGNAELLADKMQMLLERRELAESMAKEAVRIQEILHPKRIFAMWEEML